jgi:hypothetical protein
LFCKDFLIDPDYPNDIYSSIINVSEWYRIVPNDLIHRLFRDSVEKVKSCLNFFWGKMYINLS